MCDSEPLYAISESVSWGPAPDLLVICIKSERERKSLREGGQGERERERGEGGRERERGKGVQGCGERCTGKRAAVE